MEDTLEKAKTLLQFNASQKMSGLGNTDPAHRKGIHTEDSHNGVTNKMCFVVSGSQAEAMGTPGKYSNGVIDVSDVDCLFVLSNFTITKDKKDRSTFVLDSSEVHSGYTRLQYFQEFSNYSQVFQPGYDLLAMVKVKEHGVWTYSWVASEGIAERYASKNARKITSETVHGPSLKTTQVDSSPVGHLKHENSSDNVPALRYEYWPSKAREWVMRVRGKWPERNVIINIVKNGCHLVPVAHPKSAYPRVEWRFSFSEAEIVLCQTIPYYARKAYVLFKLLCKYQLKSLPIICTYYLKTTMLWALEKTPDVFHGDESNLSSMLFRLIDELLLYLERQCLPSYFIESNNLIDHIPQCLIQEVLQKVQCLKGSCLDILFCLLKDQTLDTLPLVHDMESIFEPCIENIKHNGISTEDACNQVIANLSTAFYLEGRKYIATDIVRRFYALTQSDWILDDHKLCQSIATLQNTEPVFCRMLKKQEELELFFGAYTPNLVTIWRKAHLNHINLILQKEETDTQISELSSDFMKALHLVTDNIPSTNVNKFMALLHYTLFYLKYSSRFKLPSMVDQFHTYVSHAATSFIVHFHMVDGPALPVEIGNLLHASQVIVQNGRCLGFYLLFIEQLEKGNLENAALVSEELIAECTLSDGDDNPNNISLDSRHYLAALMYTKLGKHLEAARHFYMEVIGEYHRSNLSIIPDNGLMYRLCVLGNCIIENNLLNCGRNSPNDIAQMSDKVLVYSRE